MFVRRFTTSLYSIILQWKCMTEFNYKIPTVKDTVKQAEREEAKAAREQERALEKEKAANKKKRGRPRKEVLQAKKTPGKRGRPKGEAAIMQDYKARMLASPKSNKVIEAIYNAALDNEHKNQAAAWKLIMDRMLPVSMFEKEVSSGGGRPTVNITIGTVGEVDISQSNDDTDNDQEDDYLDGEVIDNE